MIKEILEKLLFSQDLSFEESHQKILWIMSEDAIAVKAAAMLALLQAKGISVDEMVKRQVQPNKRKKRVDIRSFFKKS